MQSLFAFSRTIGVCRGLAIAKPRLPLTRELSSKARLRERKGCVFMRSYFSPSVFLLTQKSTSQLPFRSVLLSLRLEIATGNPHPRQREARAVIKFYPYNPRFIFTATFLHYLFLPYPLMLTLNINYAIIKTLIMFKLNMIGDNKYG